MIHIYFTSVFIGWCREKWKRYLHNAPCLGQAVEASGGSGSYARGMITENIRKKDGSSDPHLLCVSIPWQKEKLNEIRTAVMTTTLWKKEKCSWKDNMKVPQAEWPHHGNRILSDWRSFREQKDMLNRETGVFLEKYHRIFIFRESLF